MSKVDSANTGLTDVGRPSGAMTTPVMPTAIAPHAYWSIADVDLHGAWPDHPHLEFPTAVDPNQTLINFSDLNHGKSLPIDVMVIHVPGDPRVTYQETIPAADRAGIIEIPTNPGAFPQFKVNFDVPDGAPDVHASAYVDLLSSYGESLGRMPVPRPGTGYSFLIQAHPGLDGALPGLMLGITRTTNTNDPASLSTSPPISFAISFDRAIGASQGSSSGPFSRTEVDLGSYATSRWLPTPKIGELAQGNDPSLDDGEVNDVEPALGIGQVVAGSFPLRSAGPSGGVLADGESAPQIDAIDGALIDLTLLELSTDVASAGFEGDSGSLVALTSASGFPLLATARPAILIESEDALDSGIEDPVLPSREDIAKEEEIGNKPAPTPVTLGVGVAAGLTFGLLLPDVIARLAPRAAGKPRPRWSRRYFWRKIK